MTEKEKKATQSEISVKKGVFAGVDPHDLSIRLHYVLLRGHDSVTYHSPVDGYVHIILTEGCWSGAYTLDGRAHIIRCCENTVHPVQQGSVLEWKNLNEETVVIVLFSAATVTGSLMASLENTPPAASPRLIAKNSQQLSLIAQRMLAISSEQDRFLRIRMQILALEVIWCQLKEYDRGSTPQAGRHHRQTYYDKMLAVKRIIEQDLSKNYTLADLAKEVGTNEQYIKKYFKQYFGKTVMNYVTGAKMDYAKRLIMTGEYRISDVARMTGYKHSTHFTTTFKKYFGYIPNSLRFVFWGGSIAALVESTTWVTTWMS